MKYFSGPLTRFWTRRRDSTSSSAWPATGDNDDDKNDYDNDDDYLSQLLLSPGNQDRLPGKYHILFQI